MKRSRRFRRVYFQQSIRFWIMAVVLCFLTALAAVGIKILFESVGGSTHTRYEPVDVPPAELSPRHAREREELQRREKVVEQETK